MCAQYTRALAVCPKAGEGGDKAGEGGVSMCTCAQCECVCVVVYARPGCLSRDEGGEKGGRRVYVCARLRAAFPLSTPALMRIQLCSRMLSKNP